MGLGGVCEGGALWGRGGLLASRVLGQEGWGALSSAWGNVPRCLSPAFKARVVRGRRKSHFRKLLHTKTGSVPGVVVPLQHSSYPLTPLQTGTATAATHLPYSPSHLFPFPYSPSNLFACKLGLPHGFRSPHRSLCWSSVLGGDLASRLPA